MNIDLTGRTAIVSGSSAGIGWGCARGLAAAGAIVVLTGRRADALNDARKRILAEVSRATVRWVATDLATPQGCAELVVAEGRCDILVNSLGVYEPKPFFDTPDADWHRLFEVNVMAGMRLAKAYMRAMMDTGWGRVVFVSSEAGVNVPTDSIHYGVTKASVLALSRGLAKLAGRSGVTVNAVLPGVTRAEWVVAMIEGLARQSGKTFDDAAHDAVAARYPTSITQRVQSLEEVANLVVYLCSELSSATIGAALRAEGGIVDTII
jgi:NAD(P)-dependent dehydrogenase (short-subunit alcohol dehydrogenase family)